MFAWFGVAIGHQHTQVGSTTGLVLLLLGAPVNSQFMLLCGGSASGQPALQRYFDRASAGAKRMGSHQNDWCLAYWVTHLGHGLYPSEWMRQTHQMLVVWRA